MLTPASSISGLRGCLTWNNRYSFPHYFMPGITLPDGVTMSREVSRSSVNLQPLLRHTQFHPKGRIKLNENGEPDTAQNNVLYIKDVPILVELKNGQSMNMGTRRVPVNGGHALGKNPLTGEKSVWRIALSPTKYHLKVLKEIDVRRDNPKERVAPDLDVGGGEWKEYQMYREYLKVVNKVVDEDIGFYEWIRDNDVSVEQTLDGYKVVVGVKQEPKTVTNTDGIIIEPPVVEPRNLSGMKKTGRPVGSKNKKKQAVSENSSKDVATIATPTVVTQ